VSKPGEHTHVLPGANASASDASDREALSSDVFSIKQEILGYAGTTYNNKPVFSGTYGTSPYPQGPASGISDPTNDFYDPVSSLQTQLGDITDANEDQVATSLDLAEASYQAALDTTATIIPPSLAQFLL
jgi:flagellin-like hook-associated protein FlgL